MEIPIIFEDKWIAVIDKPAGVVVNKAESVTGETIQEWFSNKYSMLRYQDTGEFFKKGGVVHRLDKDTSGLLVLAKTEEAYDKLKIQFLERTTQKKYTALVHGLLDEESGEISTPIERNPIDKKKFTVGTDLSKMAITEWKVLNQYSVPVNQYSLMELMPHTGRTHQLRVHMKYLHHPMVSDPIYGDKKTWKQDLEWCPRLFLHAQYLKITHPMSGETHEFTSQLPLDLVNALEKLVD